MNTHATISTRVARSARSLAVTGLAVVAMGMGLGLDRLVVEQGAAATRLTSADSFTVLEETYESIRQNYVLESDVTDDQLIYGAAKGMVDALGDTGHSVFLDPQQAQDFQQSSRGELIGIGVQVDTTGDLPVIIAPMQNSPASRAGILPGDTILAVDGQDLTGMSATDAVDLITGEAGTDVTITLRHEGETEPYDVTITREKIDINPVSWVMLPNDIMWLRLDQFSSGATEGIQDAIRQGQQQGMKGLILDLRGNPGGLVFEAVGVASQFLPDNTPLYQDVNKDGDTKIMRTAGSNGVYLDGPMAVLIDGNSASAAEIVSSALLESGRAQAVGQTTFGTGTVLLPFELSDGSMAVLGVELWLTGQGNEIYHVGVKPQQEVALADGARVQLPWVIAASDGDNLTDAQVADLNDAQLEAAIEWVTNAN